MKFRVALLLLMIVAVVTNIEAQNIGFRVAIAPPSQPVQQPAPYPTANVVINSPIQPFFSAPIQPFGFGQLPIQPFGFVQQPFTTFGYGATPHMVPPIITTSYSPIFSQFQNQPIVQPFVGYGIGQPFVSSGLGGNGITVIVPNGTVITNSTVVYQQPQPQAYNIAPRTTATPAFTPPAIGMPRAQVIQQYGTPSTAIITQTGETLFFSGGMQIFIQNDRVARPN